MAKAGQTKATTQKEKDFAAPGVQGQKGQQAAQVTGTPPADDQQPPAAPPAGEKPKQQKAAPADHGPTVVRGEDVLKAMREKGHQV